MTRFAYDEFAKDFLEELLSPLGEVKAPLEVRGESRQVDVWFAPSLEGEMKPEEIGLLGKMATTPALFEPFRNAATVNEICLPGIYFCPKFFRTALVVIHKLPKNQETLWLRLLGRGRVQQGAIDEIEALPETDKFRSNALLLLSNLQTNLTQTQEQLEEEDRELIMRLSPLLTKKLQDAEELGKRMERLRMIENFFRARFGSVDEELSTIIEPMLLLSSEELTQILLQLSTISREELLSRFGGDNS